MWALLIAMVLLPAMGQPIVAAAGTPTPDDGVDQRIESILSRMTIEEKIDLLGGVRGSDVPGVPRLGVPSMATADGPFGVRHGSRSNVMAGGIAPAAARENAFAGKGGGGRGGD